MTRLDDSIVTAMFRCAITFSMRDQDALSAFLDVSTFKRVGEEESKKEKEKGSQESRSRGNP